MDIVKILDLENDGKMNMVVNDDYIYIRCKRSVYKYDLSDMSLKAHNEIFKKDGKARGFKIFDEYIFLYDFCELYIIDKKDLQIISSVKLGADLSSDICGIIDFVSPKLYVNIRNGLIYVFDIDTNDVKKYEINDTGFWCSCTDKGAIITGSVSGELLKTDKSTMEVICKVELCKKNIYGVVVEENSIYTVSQDTTIKSVDVSAFETICVAKKAVKGMARILGMHKETLVIVDSGQVSFWDKETLQQKDRFDFPVGQHNAGVILSENRLFGHDYNSLYVADLD